MVTASFRAAAVRSVVGGTVLFRNSGVELRNLEVRDLGIQLDSS